MASHKIEIKVSGINYKYSNGNQAIKEASFTLNEGVICALVGPNGGGKSTLFKSLMGFIKPYSGSILFNGHPIEYVLKQNQIAYVPQTEEVDWDFPILVKDVVMMGRYSKMNFLRIPSQNDIRLVNQSLELVGLGDYKQRQIGELSGGQKKRVFLARALAQEGDILMLDEPFTGVDVQTENAIIELLQYLKKKGALILIATHNLGSVPEFCDEVILFNRTVIGFGKIETTFTEENLKKTFGGVLRHIRLGKEHLHDDDDPRIVTVLTDDERPAVFYGNTEQDPPKSNPKG